MIGQHFWPRSVVVYPGLEGFPTALRSSISIAITLDVKHVIDLTCFKLPGPNKQSSLVGEYLGLAMIARTLKFLQIGISSYPLPTLHAVYPMFLSAHQLFQQHSHQCRTPLLLRFVSKIVRGLEKSSPMSILRTSPGWILSTWTTGVTLELPGLEHCTTLGCELPGHLTSRKRPMSWKSNIWRTPSKCGMLNWAVDCSLCMSDLDGVSEVWLSWSLMLWAAASFCP